MADLKVFSFPQPGPCETVVQACKDLLASAEAGDLTAVLSVGVKVDQRDGSTDTFIAWDSGADPAQMLGGLEVIRAQLLHRLMDGTP